MDSDVFDSCNCTLSLWYVYNSGVVDNHIHSQMVIHVVVLSYYIVAFAFLLPWILYHIVL